MANMNAFIGNYSLIAEIRSGSFASVYLGKHRIFDDDPVVAIKLLHAHLGSPQDRNLFIQEARLLKKLSHASILPILGAGIHGSSLYLVIEYAPNGTLRDLLSRSSQPLAVNEGLTLLSQIGQALQYAHEYVHERGKGIVHRDLKPENILFNSKREALLADFGIASLLDATGTRRGDAIGTPPYMAPEQFDGIISTKGDQYALGCIAYELFTGRKPFDLPPGSNWYAWKSKHESERPIPPRQLNPQLPAHIEQAILKALEKDRTRRHPTVAAFITAIHQTKEQWLDEGNILYDLKRYGEALSAYEQALGLDPNYANAYFGKGRALFYLKRFDKALAAFEQALQLDSNYARAYNGKGGTLRALKRYEEALAAYEEALHLDPNFAIAYYNKSLALRDLNRPQEALAAFEQALRLDPNNAIAYNNKGLALRDLKRYEEALAAYEQALRLDPNYAKAYNNKGYVLEQLGRASEAQQVYDKARQLDYEW